MAFGPLLLAGRDKIVLPVYRGGSPVFVTVCELGWAEELEGGGAFVCSYPGWQEGTKGLVVVLVDG